jgi:hypothetical protein
MNHLKIVTLAAFAALSLLSSVASGGSAQAAPVKRPVLKKQRTAKPRVKTKMGAPTKPPVTAKVSATAKANAMPKTRPLYAVGRCVDSSGKPIKNVSVFIYGTTAAGEKTNFRTRSKADGTFSQRVPDGIYGVQADHEVIFNGKTYTFRLHPTDEIADATHDAAEGFAKEFVWKLSGLQPGEQASDPNNDNEYLKYHGLYVIVYAAVDAPPGSTVEVTLTPRGPLIDGSHGKPVVSRKSFKEEIKASNSTFQDWKMYDVPLGLYTVTARLVGQGSAQALGVKSATDAAAPFAPAFDIEFVPTDISHHATGTSLTVGR